MTGHAGGKPPSELWVMFILVLTGLFASGMLVGVYHLLTYSLPMHHKQYEFAAQSYLGYEGDALFDAALSAYELEHFRRAVPLLNAVEETLHDSSGKLIEEKRALAAEIKFLAGNIFVKENQPQQAIKAYEEALRRNPDHRYAKYNLELLKHPPLGGDGNGDGKGKGGGEGDADPDESPSGTKSGPPPKGI